MKLNIILACFTTVMGWATCKNLQKTTAESTPVVPTAPAAPVQDKADMYPMRVAHVLGSNDDASGTVQITAPPRPVTVPMDRLPKASTSRKAYLSSGWWHLDMAYSPSDTLVHVNYKPKWLHFREDQTFDILINNKVVDSGQWNWDEASNEIYLACKDPYINNTWKVTDRGFLMIWKGNTDVNLTGIQVRVVGTKTPPTGN